VRFESSDKQQILISWLCASIMNYHKEMEITFCLFSCLVKGKKTMTLPFLERMDASSFRRGLHVLDWKWREISACSP